MAKRDESLYEKIIDYVNGYYDRKGHAPSTREIERNTGIPVLRCRDTSSRSKSAM